jgi:hypothetical protein
VRTLAGGHAVKRDARRHSAGAASREDLRRLNREGMEGGEARDELVIDERAEAKAGDDESAGKSAPLGEPFGHHRERRDVRHAGPHAADQAVSQIQPGSAE